jgi:hypothetical protein
MDVAALRPFKKRLVLYLGDLASLREFAFLINAIQYQGY